MAPIGPATALNNIPLSQQFSTNVPGVFSLRGLAIPSSFNAFITNGFLSSSDNGAGCTYVRATGSATVKFSDGAGGLWTLPRNKPVDISCLGAIGDGGSHPLSGKFGTLAAARVFFPMATSLSQEIDDAAFKEAVSVAASNVGGLGRIEFPAGAFRVDTTNLNSNTSVRGQGPNSSIIIAATPSSTPFTMAATDAAPETDILIEGVGFQSYCSSTSADTATCGSGASATILQSANPYVNFKSCTHCRLSEFQMANGFIGWQVDNNNMDMVTLDHGRILNSVYADVLINGGSGIYIDTVDGVGVNASNASYGLKVTQNFALSVTNSAFVYHAQNIAFVPGANQVIQSLFFNNVQADSGKAATSGSNIVACGLCFLPTNGGKIDGVTFVNSWSAGSAGEGLYSACDAQSAISHLRFTAQSVVNNANNGYNLNCGSILSITGSGLVSGNGTNGNKSAIYLNNVKYGIVSDQQFQAASVNGSLPSPTVVNTITLGGSTDYFDIHDNISTGAYSNGTGNGIANGSSGTHNQIINNVN